MDKESHIWFTSVGFNGHSSLVVVAAAMIAWRQGEPVIGTYRRGINPHAVRRAPRGYCKEEAPRSFLKNLITKLNAENPHLFRAMIIQSDITKAKLQVLPLNTG
ncbi:hypothetical protein V6N13_120696 [Hibiscus sabdariffa]